MSARQPRADFVSVRGCFISWGRLQPARRARPCHRTGPRHEDMPNSETSVTPPLVTKRLRRAILYTGPDTPDCAAITSPAGAPGGRDGPAGGVGWCTVRQAHDVLAGQGGQEGGWYDSGVPFKTENAHATFPHQGSSWPYQGVHGRWRPDPDTRCIPHEIRWVCGRLRRIGMWVITGRPSSGYGEKITCGGPIVWIASNVIFVRVSA